jgi:PIN domain nuclease of toxin-antitoxin system
MRLLLDTHVLLWALMAPQRLLPGLRQVLVDPAHEVLFSAASIWEIAIRRGLDRPAFAFEPADIAAAARAVPFAELPVCAGHAAAVRTLPALHADPFDRLLIAQATAEGALLVSDDSAVLRYPAPVRAPADF